MSHFYATIKGNRGEASRCGSKGSGISGHIRGWHIGGQVNCWIGPDGEDRVSITLTQGSNGCGDLIHLGTYKLVDGYAVKC